MARRILIKPVITEKAEKQANKSSKYSFVVDRDSNKIEVRKAVEALYNVTVEDVNTHTIPGKRKARNTKTGVVKGQKSAYKKAVVTLKPGDSIDLFGEQ